MYQLAPVPACQLSLLPTSSCFEPLLAPSAAVKKPFAASAAPLPIFYCVKFSFRQDGFYPIQDYGVQSMPDHVLPPDGLIHLS